MHSKDKFSTRPVIYAVSSEPSNRYCRIVQTAIRHHANMRCIAILFIMPLVILLSSDILLSFTNGIFIHSAFACDSKCRPNFWNARYDMPLSIMSERCFGHIGLVGMCVFELLRAWFSNGIQILTVYSIINRYFRIFSNYPMQIRTNFFKNN